MSPETIRRVQGLAAGRCEYCRLPSALHPAPFQIDHITAKQHGGSGDPETEELTRLFHPRVDAWNDHFGWNRVEILLLSSIGRVTVSVLFMNDPEVVWLRSTLAVQVGRS